LSDCHAWSRVVDEALAKGYITVARRLAPTAHGRAQVELEMQRFGGNRPEDPTQSKARLGAIGTSAMVQKDEALFSARRLLRYILGVDMEAAEVGSVAHAWQIPFFVAKGVVDYADLRKSDNFRVYAAEASAAFVVDFLMSKATSTGVWV
jgi:nucleoside phosphorylase